MTYSSSNNFATHTLQNAQGCDSTVVLQLTIVDVDTEVTENNLSLIVAQDNADYQWLDCNNNFAEIENETSQEFTPSQNGSYAVIVNWNDCSETSSCTNFGNIGIEDFGIEFKAYPNPTNGKIKFDLGSNYATISTRVITVDGRLLSEQSFKNNRIIELEIQAEHGVYYVEITTENANRIVPVFKQ
jgi:hypothetical protein